MYPFFFYFARSCTYALTCCHSYIESDMERFAQAGNTAIQRPCTAAPRTHTTETTINK